MAVLNAHELSPDVAGLYQAVLRAKKLIQWLNRRPIRPSFRAFAGWRAGEFA
jgi:hypothetical protein